MPKPQDCEFCNYDLTLYHKFSYGFLHKCKYCSSEFLYATEKVKYDKDYYRSWFRTPNQKVEAIKRINFQRLLRVHFDSLENKKLLDIGCATGFLLREAQSLGAEIYGIDINEWAVKQTKKKLPNAILYCGSLEQALKDEFFDEDYFDIIVGTDVIEHVSEVRPFLDHVLRIMKQDGKAAFTTPDAESLSHRLLGPYWFQYKPEHINFITRKGLTLLSSQMGFRVETVVPVKKILSLEYLFDVLRHNSTGVVGWLGVLGSVLVKYLLLAKSCFSFPTGEMLFLISKT